MAFQIVRHAFFMVFSNFGQAIRLSIGPFLLAAGAIYVLSEVFRIGAVTVMMMAMNPANADLTIIAVLILMALIFIFTTAWIAVAWHRFILIEEYVTVLPKLRDRPILGYLWQTTVIGFWILLFAILIGFFGGIVAAVVLAIVGPSASSVLEVAVNLLLAVITSYLWFRMALVLPALAVNERMSIQQSFSKTEFFGKTIWQIVFILTFLNFIAQLISGAFLTFSMAVQLGIGAAIYWVTFMVGLSILTTLYGHLVEDRPLVD